jgi:hypothetical protein
MSQSKAPMVQDASQVAGQTAQGAALAELFMKYVEENGNKLKSVLQSLTELSNVGRDQFRREVDMIRKTRAEFVKEAKGTDKHDFLKRVHQSAAVRLSEVSVFSKALDLGYTPDFNQTYHTIVSEARMFKDSKASSGAETRGRKAKPDIDKAMEYLAKLSLTEEDRNKLLEFVAAGCTDVEPATV